MDYKEQFKSTDLEELFAVVRKVVDEVSERKMSCDVTYDLIFEEGCLMESCVWVKQNYGNNEIRTNTEL